MAAKFESNAYEASLRRTRVRASPLQSYLELLRLPNVFTAVADVAMGFFFVQAAWAFNSDVQPPALLPIGIWSVGLLVAASASLYLAGMVLNDVFDIELDDEEQPYRPLPSGRISLSAARWLGWNLLSAGVMLAAAVAVLLQRVPAAHVESLIHHMAAGARGGRAGCVDRTLQRLA